MQDGRKDRQEFEMWNLEKKLASSEEQATLKTQATEYYMQAHGLQGTTAYLMDPASVVGMDYLGIQL